MSVRVRAAQQNVSTTWPKVRKMHLKMTKSASNNPSPRGRPDTATLEKPVVLDPFYIRKVDMTRLTRERLMTIENLIASPKKQTPSPRRVKETAGHKEAKKEKHKSTKEKINDDSFNEEEKRIVDEPKIRKISRVLNTTFRLRSCTRKGLKEALSPSPTHLQVPTVCTPSVEIVKINNCKNSVRSPVARNKKQMEDLFGTVIGQVQVIPPPCIACGREELPERLHAHPKRQQIKKNKSKDNQENKEIVQQQQQKNSVTKPVPIKFRSGKSRGKPQTANGTTESDKTTPSVNSSLKSPEKPSTAIIRRETFRVDRSDRDGNEKKNIMSSLGKLSPAANSNKRVTAPAPPTNEEEATIRDISPHTVTVVHSASPRRPRTIVCYVCSKQFGTASFHLHEPQCIQRWQRENAELPAHLRMPLPQKPDVPVTADQWNQYAWEATQASLVPCDKCGRTFLPTRIEAHHRVCPQIAKKTVTTNKQFQDDESDRGNRSCGPTTVHCHICGRMFTRASIIIHENHCLKRWNEEHSKPPPPPVETGQSSKVTNTTAPLAAPRRRFVLCYICGRQFGTSSIAIHEPQCLKKWHLGNDKLPLSQRRSEPKKPEAVIDIETGQIDYVRTEEAAWQCHLTHLVPCYKCGRKFNPDRVRVHEKCCKSSTKN